MQAANNYFKKCLEIWAGHSLLSLNECERTKQIKRNMYTHKTITRISTGTRSEIQRERGAGDVYEPLGQKKREVQYLLYVLIQAGAHRDHRGQRSGQGEYFGECCR